MSVGGPFYDNHAPVTAENYLVPPVLQQVTRRWTKPKDVPVRRAIAFENGSSELAPGQDVASSCRGANSHFFHACQ